jgi:hypothetical protein
MILLIKDAAPITGDPGDVTFLGTVALVLHIKYGRQSPGLNFVVATIISDEKLEEKRYFKNIENGKEIRRIPNGYMIDIYHDRPINNIPIPVVLQNAVYVQVSKKIK